LGYLVSRLAVVQLVFNRRHRGPVPLPQPLDEFDVLLGPRAYAARGEERREQLIHPTPLDARDGPRRGERHLDRKRRERGEMVEERDGEDSGSLGARLRHSRRHRRERETRHQTHPPVFRFNRCWRATVQDFCRPSSPSSPRGPGSYRSMHPTVTPAGTTAPDVYDDRTRHACVTRGEGSCVPTEPAREEPVLDTSSSAFFSSRPSDSCQR